MSNSAKFAKLTNKRGWWLLIALLSILINLGLQIYPLPVQFYPADEFMRSSVIRQRASTEHENRFALLDIDEVSIAKIGRWPWSRNQIADIIEILLTEYEVSGIALDLVFSEKIDATGDDRLAKLAEFGPIIFSQVFDYNPKQSWPLRIGHLALAQTPQQIDVPAKTAYGYIANNSRYAKVRYIGNIGVIHDSDGNLRKIPWYSEFQGHYFPTLAKAAFDCCSGKQLAANQQLPLIDRDGLTRIPYLRSQTAYQGASIVDVLNRKIPKSEFQGKLVIIGSTSLSLSDRVPTPLSPVTPGFYVHAEMLSTLYDIAEAKYPANWPGKALSILFSIIIAFLVYKNFPYRSALQNIIILFTSSAAWLIIAYFLIPRDPFFAPSSPILSNLFLAIIAIPYGWQVSQQKSMKLLHTLNQYVAKPVVNELLKLNLDDPLAPSKCTVTTLIADMEGYTHHVEYLSIEEASELTRQFLELLTAPVLEYGGTLDKYTGDGLVAFWGAPLPVANHADLALLAAKKIVDNVRAMSAKRVAQGLPGLRVRIGIESGLAMAGDFGTSFRSIYTAVGDSVNVASRLEHMARDYPYDILIGQGTVDSASEHQFQLLGTRMLRGKELPTSIFTLAESKA